MSFYEVVEWSWAPLPLPTATIGPMSERLDRIRHRTYGGHERMSIIENEGLRTPLDSGWKPGQIYELCLLEGTLKDQLIQNLRDAHRCHLYISDSQSEFRDLKSIQSYLESIPVVAELLIIDISEILYLDFIKDFEQLKATLTAFYRSLEKLAKAGVRCVVFVNHLYYQQIFRNLVRPDSIQVLIYPSQISPFWEAKVAAPAELNSWESLFSPSSGEVPYFL